LDNRTEEKKVTIRLGAIESIRHNTKTFQDLIHIPFQSPTDLIQRQTPLDHPITRRLLFGVLGKAGSISAAASYYAPRPSHPNLLASEAWIIKKILSSIASILSTIVHLAAR
jgi:hypothetical protein